MPPTPIGFTRCFAFSRERPFLALSRSTLVSCASRWIWTRRPSLSFLRQTPSMRAESSRLFSRLGLSARRQRAGEHGGKIGCVRWGSTRFDDPTNDERRERLARNAALKDWPER